MSNIWSEFDLDDSGTLCKAEARQFIDFIVDGQSGAKGINDTEFDKLFRIFDADNSGFIDRKEMAEILKSFLGI